jgi:hypothetical protein
MLMYGYLNLLSRATKKSKPFACAVAPPMLTAGALSSGGSNGCSNGQSPPCSRPGNQRSPPLSMPFADTASSRQPSIRKE